MKPVKQTHHTGLLRLLFSVCLLQTSVVAISADSTAVQTSPKTLIKTTLARHWIPMRDGVRLDADIYLPKQGTPPYPTVLIRSPYPLEFFASYYSKKRPYTDFLAQGYAIVFQNERGRYWSEGEGSFLANAKHDGYDTVDWISQQTWSNGKVGTIGCSSSAENQLGLSVANHPAHRAAIAQAPGAGIGNIGPYQEQGNIYRGGALQGWAPAWFHEYIMYSGDGAEQRPQFPADLSQTDRARLAKIFKLWPWGETWGKPRKGFDYAAYYQHLPFSELNQAIEGSVTDWDDFAKRTPADPAWADTHFVNEGDTFHTPMLWAFSWYDLAIAPNVALFNHITQTPEATGPRAKDQQYMIISPVKHCFFGAETENTLIGERNVGDARYDYAQHYVDWFNYWLKDDDNGVLQRPKVQYYQMGANQWRAGEQFPAAEAEFVDLYLHSNGKANSLFGDGELRFQAPTQAASDQFIYDPMFPVPTVGGGTCCMGDLAQQEGAYDQRQVETRQDILVYTTEPFTQDFTVAGFIEAEIYLASDAKDTDLTLKLVDVAPDGSAYNLDDSIFRVRYREGYNKAVLMAPGQVYKITLPPLMTANTFKAGHRLRLEISSSNFPRYDRNLNTGGNNFDESEGVIARNRIYHGQNYPSRLRLSVLP